ncbi:chemotaxis protein CheB [Ensifer sesbaniae]|uniref:chemotaxis protein CheB n=1 Tax=Ensifer sesbaniae TaxID=1214071 RepID=UPI0035E3BFF2
MTAVKEAGGIVLVQDRTTPSMPPCRSAIDTEAADFVLPLPQIADRLAELLALRDQLPATYVRSGDEDFLGRILAHTGAHRP